MDYAEAFRALTKDMEEFRGGGSEPNWRFAHSKSSADLVDYSLLDRNSHKEYLRKPLQPTMSSNPPLLSFKSLSMPPYDFAPNTVERLASCSYTRPMPVQTEVIPVFLEGHNMLVSSPTGSGKTAAYLIPILNLAASARFPPKSCVKHCVYPYCIILSITQELLDQIWVEARRLSPAFQKIAILRRTHYAPREKEKKGKSTSKKVRELRLPSETKIIITTPKRLTKLLTAKGTQCPIKFDCLSWVVIDECDKMLESNIGNKDAQLRTFHSQLAKILGSIRDNAKNFPNIALFSATLPAPVVSWATKELGDTDTVPTRGLIKIQLGYSNTAVSVVRQELRYCGSEQGKLLELRKMLVSGLVYPCLIFTESRQRAAELFKEIILCDKHILVGILSGEKSEAQRIATIKAFREGKINVLICTNLLGRGIDFKSLMMVVNFDLPPSPIEYIHRVGRAGRGGRIGGRAVTLWTDADLFHMDNILDVMARSGAEVDPDLQRLVLAWKARKAKLMHARALGGVVSKRKGERRLAAKVALKKSSKIDFYRERGLLRPWNPHRGSIADVPGSKSRDLKMINGGVMKSEMSKAKRNTKKTV